MTSHEHEDQLPGDTSRLAGRLWVAVRRFDDELASSVLNRAFAVMGPGDVADRVVVPVLRRFDDAWHDDARMIAIEHFTCQLVRARFQAHSAGSSLTGPLAVCFTPSREQHDLGVHLAASVLVDDGWRTRVLGADTPRSSALAAIEELEPALVVVSAQTRAVAEELLVSDIADRWPVLAGGPGFRPDDEGTTALVVHDGPFAAIPGIAGRLVDRASANGA